MELINKLKKPATWRAIIIVKLLLLAGIWAATDGEFYFGDATIRASGGDSKASPDQPTGKPSRGEAAEPSAKSPPPTGQAVAPAKSRLSFLANLLELPSLDAEKPRKEEIGKYLEIAERKHRQIEERLAMLRKREDQLKGLENSIDDKLKRLDEERRFFSQTIQQEKNLKGERLDRLVTLYAKMEPKKAAPVIEKLDKDLTVELFKQLPQKQVTAILEAMTPDRSVTLSEYYGRVRSTREYDTLKEMNQSLRKEFDDCKGMPKAQGAG